MTATESLGWNVRHGTGPDIGACILGDSYFHTRPTKPKCEEVTVFKRSSYVHEVKSLVKCIL